MPTLSPTRHRSTKLDLGCIEASLAYLQEQPWWRPFRDGRRDAAQLIDDVLWVGHFCRWSEQQGIGVERCTKAHLRAYLDTTASFRPGPRAACERTVTSLVEFISSTRSADTAV
jgi:hypothetical protein